MAQRKRGPVAAGDPILLDTFTAEDIEYWADRSEDAQRYCDRAYFDLERQRAAHHEALCEALRNAGSIDVRIDGWARVCDYRWSLTPLSPAGSLKRIGGRFNIGSDLDRARGQEFPALYIAEDVDTAYLEFFGGAPESRLGGLTIQEFALRRKCSFATFRLQGRVANVLDLRSPSSLEGYARIVATFDLSAETRRFARSIGVRAQPSMCTAAQLHRRILLPPKAWRAEPQLFGIPAANQTFSRYVLDAGFEAVIYPSQQGGNACLAIYPKNLAGTHIEVSGGAPVEATHLVMGASSRCT